MLREWRRARGVSQLELALGGGVSQRHLSFLETGRSRPSRGMVLHLASVLRVPLDRQNALLVAAGFAPAYGRRCPDAPELGPVRRAVGEMLERHEPYPAMVVDAGYDILRANDGLRRLMGFLMGPDADAAAADGPMNAAELMIRPDRLRGVTENWEEVGTWLIRRLQAEAIMEEGRGRVSLLLERLFAYPGVADLGQRSPSDAELPPTVTLRFRKGDIRLTLFSVIATIGTPLDVSLEDVRVELFFHADAETSEWFDG
jgi:transcriptional regulator with XRE-family HTH domain